LKRQRLDLLLSVGGIFAIGALIQIAAASVLKPMGVQLRNVEDLVLLFSGAFGPAGRVILGLGIWAAVFSTYLGTNTGYSLMVSEIYHGFIRPKKAPAGTSADELSPGNRPAYRWCLIWFCLSPLYVLLTDWKPLGLTLLANSLMVVWLPAIIVVLLRLTNDKDQLGRYANGWGTNLGMLLILATALTLTYQNVVELWTSGFSKWLR
jgi:Mn2+/Fe2+ NRAMP family transporter